MIRPGAVVAVCMSLIFAGGCSAFFWREGGPIRFLSWAGGDEFLEVRVRFREKDSLDPTAGATLKRDYQSRIFALNLARAAPRPRLLFEMSPGWILEDSVFATVGGLEFVGGTGDDYGGDQRRVYRAHDGNVREIYAAEPPFLVSRAVPAPDGRWLALLEERAPGAQSGPGAAFRLRFARLAAGAEVAASAKAQPDEALRMAPGVAESSLAFQDGPLWRPDSGGVYFTTARGVFFFGTGDDFDEPVESFPRCFRPLTSTGGPVSASGQSVYFDDSSGVYEASPVPDWRAFGSVPLITEPGRIGEDCP